MVCGVAFLLNIKTNIISRKNRIGKGAEARALAKPPTENINRAWIVIVVCKAMEEEYIIYLNQDLKKKQNTYI